VRTVALSEVCEINPPLRRRPPADEIVSFVPMSDVSTDGTTALGDGRRFGEVAKSYTLFERGDVLVAKITPCFENGKIAQALPATDVAAGSTEFHVVRSRPGLVDPRYVLHYLRHPHVRAAGERRMTGSGGQRRVPEPFLRELKLPAPPIEEQRRIAAVLDQADHVRAKRRASLALIDSLTESIFIDMFGDPVANQRGLPMRQLRELGTVVTGNTPSRDRAENYGQEIEWIKSDNIEPPQLFLTCAREGLSAVGRMRGRVVPAGAVLVTCIAGSPASIGSVAIADREVAFNQQINALVPQEVETFYAWGLLCAAKKLVQAASTASMKGLVSKSRFESITVPVASIREQQEYARRLTGLQAVRRKASQAECQLDALFASLQQRAFSGQL
jgi:type I restriction enzyme S subunit